MLFPQILKENRAVCSTVGVVSEARNKLSSNKSKVTKNLTVISNLGKEIHREKSKPSKNVELINGMVMQYYLVKEATYRLVSELLISAEELNTSLDLMQDSAFIGEAAARVVIDNKVEPQTIHQKYGDDTEALISALEKEINITREENNSLNR